MGYIQEWVIFYPSLRNNMQLLNIGLVFSVDESSPMMWHLPNNIRAHKYVPEICQWTDQLASIDAKQTESVTDFLHFEKTQSGH